MVIEERQWLRERVSQLDGGVAEAERLHQEQLASQKEERIELLRRQVTRRIMNSGLSSAWQAWYEMWEAKTYAMSRLREVGNKLRAPEVSATFYSWADSSASAKAQSTMYAMAGTQSDLRVRFYYTCACTYAS